MNAMTVPNPTQTTKSDNYKVKTKNTQLAQNQGLYIYIYMISYMFAIC